VIALVHKWNKEVGEPVGIDPERSRLLTGSIGAPESLIHSEIRVESLAELEGMFSKMAQIEWHKQWSKELEPLVVSGSTRWEIFREL
jgi:hypothetical protein